MAHFVFATLDGGGNVPPVIGIGAELVRRGHDVRIISHEAQRAAVEAAGIAFVTYTHSVAWAPLEAQSTITGLRNLIAVFTDRGIGRDVVALVHRTPADLVVVDCMLLGALDAVDKADLRHAVLFHSLHRYFDTLWRKGPIGIHSRLKGLGPRRLWREADLRIVCAAAELDSPSARSGELVWTGPVHDATAAASMPARPRVLVSLSTINYPGQLERYRRILDAVAGMDADVVLTAGPAVDPGELVLPDNVTVHGFLPHSEIMPTCSAVVGHGGHSTAMRALAHGLPLVVIPGHPMTDQPLVGKAVAAIGAGQSLSPKATVTEIRTALDDVLTRPGYAQAAGEIGERLRARPGAVVAADRLEAAVSAEISG